jgi:hypothetical protein
VVPFVGEARAASVGVENCIYASTTMADAYGGQAIPAGGALSSSAACLNAEHRFWFQIKLGHMEIRV